MVVMNHVILCDNLLGFNFIFIEVLIPCYFTWRLTGLNFIFCSDIFRIFLWQIYLALFLCQQIWFTIQFGFPDQVAALERQKVGSWAEDRKLHTGDAQPLWYTNHGHYLLRLGLDGWFDLVLTWTGCQLRASFAFWFSAA